MHACVPAINNGTVTDFVQCVCVCVRACVYVCVCVYTDAFLHHLQ